MPDSTTPTSANTTETGHDRALVNSGSAATDSSVLWMDRKKALARVRRAEIRSAISTAIL
ncbi:hypothetical protein [Nonomuraea sp. NPDC003804]|uniref:hypothetical protein n=1 Tax=Nonomuraea sp. NPDC003804 TaxID=3154547 RepID=UPI0033B09CEE